MADSPMAPEKFQCLAQNALQELQHAYEVLWQENFALRQQVAHLSATVEGASTTGSTSTAKPLVLAPLATASAGEMSATTSLTSSQSRLTTDQPDAYATLPAQYQSNPNYATLPTQLQPNPNYGTLPAQPPSNPVTIANQAAPKRPGTSTSASSLFNKTTSRLVSSLRPSAVSARLIRSYSGHRDGVWDVTAVCRAGSLIVASASADYAVRLFSVDSGRPIMAYSGHRGSANSVRFYPSPSRDLVLSAAGDSTVHLWEFLPATIISDAHKVPNSAIQAGGAASSDDFDASDEDQVAMSAGNSNSTASGAAQYDSAGTDPAMAPSSVIRIPRQSYIGHQGAVVSADFILGGQQIVSGGWDRLALVFTTETGQLLATLTGHEAELTSVSGHPSPGRPMVLTASKDASFRMWDLRDRSPQLVAAVQGHSGAVNGAVFAPGDHIISGGDDRAVRIWDIRQLSSPVAVAKPGSAVNRLSVHWNAGIIGAPLDNSHVYLYDAANCNKLGRLPRRSGGHRRIVSALCWVEQQQITGTSSAPATPNLFTAGFDHRLLGWNVSVSGSRVTSAV